MDFWEKSYCQQSGFWKALTVIMSLQCISICAYFHLLSQDCWQWINFYSCSSQSVLLIKVTFLIVTLQDDLPNIFSIIKFNYCTTIHTYTIIIMEKINRNIMMNTIIFMETRS